MTTIWPAYEGSDKTSWYPDMQVLMTTSPLACVARPPRSPTSTNPSSSRRTIGSGMLHHPFHHDLAVAQGHHDASAEPPPGKGRVFSPTLEGGAVHGPLHKGVDQDPLVVDCLSDDLARSLDSGSIEHPIVEPQPHHDRHGGLEAMEPVRARASDSGPRPSRSICACISTGSPASAAAVSARRRMTWLIRWRPSSERATAPARCSAAASVRVRPSSPMVTAATKLTRIGSAAARATSARSSSGRSVTGSVFAIATMWVNPPKAALVAPVCSVSFCGKPGSRRCACRSSQPGERMSPLASRSAAPAALIVTPVGSESPVGPRTRTFWRYISVPVVRECGPHPRHPVHAGAPPPIPVARWARSCRYSPVEWAAHGDHDRPEPLAGSVSGDRPR